MTNPKPIKSSDKISDLVKQFNKLQEVTAPEARDGKDWIIFSQTYNLYENELIIERLFGVTFKFIFEKEEPNKTEPDIRIKGDRTNKEIRVLVSKKFRNSLGSSSSNKLPVSKTGDGSEILLSIYGTGVTNSNFLNITINFYLRKNE